MDSGPKPPNSNTSANRKLLWLILALVPGAVGLLFMAIPAIGSAGLFIAFVLDLVMSVKAATVLTQDIKNATVQIAVAFLLFGFFAILNVLVVIFVACSGMRF